MGDEGLDASQTADQVDGSATLKTGHLKVAPVGRLGNRIFSLGFCGTCGMFRAMSVTQKSGGQE